MEYKDIPGFEGLYQAGDDGTIISLGRKWLSGRNKATVRESVSGVVPVYLDRHGYLRCSLRTKEGVSRNVLVHRAVCASFFVDESGTRSLVNHKDGIKTNNHKDNLEFVTREENVRHAYSTGLLKPSKGPRRRLSDDISSEIVRRKQSGQSTYMISRETGVENSVVRGCIKRLS